LLGLRVRIQPGAWMSVSCECCLLTGIILCDGPITHQTSSTECGVSSVITKPRWWGGLGPLELWSHEKTNLGLTAVSSCLQIFSPQSRIQFCLLPCAQCAPPTFSCLLQIALAIGYAFMEFITGNFVRNYSDGPII
jgi:hypothetical protein